MNAPANQRRVRALVVDDEAHVRTILKDMLGNLGCEIVGEASNGLEALTLFHEHHPDLVVLDLTMRLMSGEEVLLMILTEYPDAVVVVLTSMADEASVNECLELGAANYIRKDVPLEEIQEILRQTIEAHGLGKEEPAHGGEVQSQADA